MPFGVNELTQSISYPITEWRILGSYFLSGVSVHCISILILSSFFYYKKIILEMNIRLCENLSSVVISYLGQKFAILEEKVLLSNIFRNFTVTSKQTREELLPIGDLIMRPEHGIFVEIHRREK